MNAFGLTRDDLAAMNDQDRAQVVRLIARHDRLVAKAIEFGICDRCKRHDTTVDERYSFGVYAGIMCRRCALGYRDRCGLRPEGQGTRADFEALEGPGSY